MILCLFLAGCDAPPVSEPLILVSIVEGEGYTVENNGQLVQPGQDAVFVLNFDRGISMTDTDYPGNAQIDVQGRTVTLTLEDIRYPARVKPKLSFRYAQLTYHANGGYPLRSVDDQFTRSVSLDVHTRPNTEIGTDQFARNGYTLLCWNTKADGTGIRVGLGSRISVPDGSLDLYAQWVAWTDSTAFAYTGEDTLTIIGYTGTADLLVIPEIIDGRTVTAIASGAFENCSAATVVLPKSIKTVESDAFRNCGMTRLVLFDNIVSVGDDSFSNCINLETLYINAIESPYGYIYRRESCYADKVDLLINAQGQKKLVFYGGCSMWYNLDGASVLQAYGQDYAVINMALNGTVNSLVQMQIMEHYLESGDIFLHTPEVSSGQQLLTNVDMRDSDTPLWCGLENNYDLFTLVDLRSLGGVFDSLCAYLESKAGKATYAQVYSDDLGQTFMDATGSVSFFRNSTEEVLGDKVYLDPERVQPEDMIHLTEYYRRYISKGVQIYVSYACLNMDAVPADQQHNLQTVEDTFSAAIAAMEGPVLISQMEDFLFHNTDFYDTNYHLRSQQAKENTAIWLRDLAAQLQANGN